MNSAKFSFTLGEGFLAKLVSKLKFQTVRSPFACGKIQPQSRLSKIERPNEQSDKFRQHWSIGVYWRYHAQGRSWVGCRGGFMWGVRGCSPGKFFRFKVAKPLKFNSKHLGNPRDTGRRKEFIMAN